MLGDLLAVQTIPFVDPLAETLGTAPGKPIDEADCETGVTERVPFESWNAFNVSPVAWKYSHPLK